MVGNSVLKLLYLKAKMLNLKGEYMKKFILMVAAINILIICCKSSDSINGVESKDLENIELENNSESIKEENTKGVKSHIVSNIHDTFLIEIPVNFSRGKIWMIENIPTKVELLSKGDIQKAEKGNMVNYQQFQFKALAADTLNLKFTLRRPYGSDTTASDSTIIPIIIK